MLVTLCIISAINADMASNDYNKDMPDWEYAKHGIVLWVNNDPDAADRHFKRKLDRTIIFSSYTFVTVMNAVISYEMDKIEVAQELLRELEKRCTPTTGWIQTIKSRILGQDVPTKPVDEMFEEKIIIADSLMCSAILTLLTQDLGGFMKGSWLLRRAWKIYEQLYGQIYGLYKFTSEHGCESSRLPEPITPFDYDADAIKFDIHRSQSQHVIRTGLRTTQDTSTPRNPSRQHSNSTILEQNTFPSKSHNNEASDHPSKSNLFLNLPLNQSNRVIHQVPLSCPEPMPSPLTTDVPYLNSDLNKRTAKRLMGAVSFGFGIFQLSVSLLPPSLLKLINILGFEGNRDVGIACLNYARSTEDMRAPLATLALLWYYTIGAQLFHGDDSSIQSEIDAARFLLKNSRPQFSTSAVFLFFNARLKRLQCKTDIAIDLYDAAYRMSAQRELKMLCLHEVGWCRLIHLDFGNAMLHFHDLKQASNFSKSFYAYMTTICQGAFGRFDNLVKLRNEMIVMMTRSHCKETQIDKFIARRIHKLPTSENDRSRFHVQYWKFFVYEMLFLWNTLSSCPLNILNTIISDCSATDDAINEPSIGLAKLILGACKLHLKQLDSAIQDFRECIQKRIDVTEDIYISAYANYELAALLLKQQNERATQEAKSLLINVQKLYKNYDFENRLSARVYSMLKNL